MKVQKRQEVWRIGIVDGFEYELVSPQGLARVKLIDKHPGILTKPFPVVFPFVGVDKTFFMPKVGDRVCCLTDENAEDGLILGSVYPKQMPTPAESAEQHIILFSDGTKLEYDKRTRSLIIETEGSLDITCGGDITLKGENIYLN